jgi:integrase
MQRCVDRKKAGLPVVSETQLNRPIEEAIEAYLDELRRLGRSAAHVANEEGFLRRLSFGCNWTTLANVNPHSVEEYIENLHRNGKSPRTQNAYRDSANAFCRYCVRKLWLNDNPLATIPKAKIGERRPRRRRSLTIDEFGQLVLVARRGDIYKLAGLSGLRRKELSLLEVQDFVLGEKPQWRLRAEIAKSKRYEVIPMLPECAELLEKLVAGKQATDRIFPSVPIQRTFNRDLERAGISKKEDRGRRADFHSLRYFFCTLTGRTLPIQVVRVLMRHKDIRTTCNLYMDLGLDDVNETLANLPRLMAPKLAPNSQS